MPVAGPTVVRRQLGRRLRRLRAQADVTVDEVVAHRRLGISRAKLFKLEAGKHPAKPQDVTVLCAHYGAAEEETATLTGLALASQEQSWWHVYGENAVPAWFSLYVDLEPAASAIRTYEAELIPGILQTRAYALAIYREADPDARPDEIERRVNVRMERQDILDRADPPQLHAVLNEASLRRRVGGEEVMAGQLEWLRELARKPHVDIDYLPFDSGAHASMAGAFVILDFPNPEDDPSVVYIDTASAAAYLEKTAELKQYNAIFERVLPRARSILEYSP